MAAATTRVVIVGGGFAGLYAVQGLRRAPVEVTLVDRRNFHLFQPLLYQVATGALSPADIAAPLRYVLKRQRNARVLLAEVTGIDTANGRALLSDGALDYDALIVAAGAGHHYFGHPEWASYAPGLKTIEDATDIRHRILLAFEVAEREPDPARRAAWLRFVVVGAGPTGVELAGALGEIANDTLRDDFRAIRSTDAEIVLLEAGARVLPSYDPSLSAKAQRALEHLGVTVRLGASVTALDAEGVSLRSGERLAARTVLWGAGVLAAPLAAVLARATGAAADRAGRIAVAPDLSVPGHAEIFVIGDMALCVQDGAPLPGVAPVAMAQGRYVAGVIAARVRSAAAPAPFRYRDKGIMATIGRAKAVAQMRGLRLSGLPAWLAWLFIHILYLAGYQSRLLVLIQWAWSYTTRNRGARLITGTSPLPLPISAAGEGADPPAPR